MIQLRLSRLSPTEGTIYIHFCTMHSKKVARWLQPKIHFGSLAPRRRPPRRRLHRPAAPVLWLRPPSRRRPWAVATSSASFLKHDGSQMQNRSRCWRRVGHIQYFLRHIFEYGCSVEVSLIFHFLGDSSFVWVTALMIQVKRG
jgi:hypothetical protein